MAVITRFAPSPTGSLHIGSARTALFNYYFTKNKGGKFLLRIEDTDQKRSTQAAVSAILDGMEWLGIRYDDVVIFQSENLERHKQVAHQLLEKGQAYHCYVLAEELEEMRLAAEKRGEVFRFKSPWRDKQPSQNMSNKPVIRIKAPQFGETIIKDLVQDEVRVANSELDDLVMLRSDGTPTYMLAAVVDDYDMGITHIIRGDDHLTNAFRQKIIYQAMEWKLPNFAHIPLIYGADGTKMSKRHGATSITEYQQMGYLPQAMRNYLLRLGWSHGDDEIIPDEKAIKWFGLDKIGRSPARFDFAKLNNINKYYIKEIDEEELFELIKDHLEIGDCDYEPDRIARAIRFLKERVATLKELADLTKIYRDDFRKTLKTEEQEIIKINQQILLELRGLISKINEWNHDKIKEEINNYANIKKYKIKDLAPILRLALTFSSESAGGIFDIIEILGKEETSARLDSVLNLANDDNDFKDARKKLAT